jgi:ABC-type nitrate/sulfonate/bicarbonate transport system substrate-binding protein
MRHLTIAFRNYSSHPTLLRLMKQHANQSHDLDWDLVFIGSIEEAADTLFSGGVDLIVGQHFTPYYDLLQGKRIVCLATGENVFRNRLVTVPTIRSLHQLEGRRFVEAERAWMSCIGLSVQVWLDHVGLGGEVKPVLVDENEHLDAVLAGRGDATMLEPNQLARAREAGLIVHDDLPMLQVIQGVTITTRWDVVEKQRDVVLDFLKSLVDGIHFWKTHRDETIAVLEDVSREFGHPRERKALEETYETYRHTLEIKPYPHPQAVMNAFAKCVKLYPQAAQVNPGTLWDIGPLREVDESGYIDALYRDQPEPGLTASGKVST